MTYGYIIKLSSILAEMEIPSTFGDLFRKIAIRKSLKERREKDDKAMEVITYATHDLVLRLDPEKDKKMVKKEPKAPEKVDGWYVLSQQLERKTQTKVKTMYGKQHRSHSLHNYKSPPPTRMLMSRRNRKVAEMELSTAVKPLSPLQTSYPGVVNKDAWF